MVECIIVTWTMLIGGYAQNNRFYEAFGLFAEMCRHGTKPDHVALATLLYGFPKFDSINEVAQVHAHVFKLGYDSTLMVCNSLLDSYCKTHNLGLACHLFKHMPERDNITFNALLTGYSKEGFNHDAIKLFFRMQDLGIRPTEFTFAAVRNLFYEMSELDGISCNVLITCYAWSGRVKESLELFRELHFSRFDQRQFPYATLLSIAANALNLDMGKQIHSQAVVTDAISEILVENSLVDMYAKCDKFSEANRIFANLARQTSVLWTTLISAYVQKGHHEDGLRLFTEMQRANIIG